MQEIAKDDRLRDAYLDGEGNTVAQEERKPPALPIMVHRDIIASGYSDISKAKVPCCCSSVLAVSRRVFLGML